MRKGALYTKMEVYVFMFLVLYPLLLVVIGIIPTLLVDGNDELLINMQV